MQPEVIANFAARFDGTACVEPARHGGRRGGWGCRVVPLTGPVSPPLKVWVAGARPRTLPAAIVPVVVGTAAGYSPAAGSSRASPGRAAVPPVLCQLRPPAVLAQRAAGAGRGAGHPDRHQLRQRLRRRRTWHRRAAGRVPSAWSRAGWPRCARSRSPRRRLRRRRRRGARPGGPGDVVVHPPRAALLRGRMGLHRWARGRTATGFGELFVFVFFGLVATAGSAYVQHAPFVCTSAGHLFSYAYDWGFALWAGVPVGSWRPPSSRRTTCATSRRTPNRASGRWRCGSAGVGPGCCTATR